MLSREGVSLKKIREAEGGILLIRPYVTENFVEDPFPVSYTHLTLPTKVNV